MPASPLVQVRKICRALPEAHEVEAWGEPTFRVKNKLFAMFADGSNHHGGGRPCVWIKSTHVNQDLLL
ncbi:MAG TPA: MmcQ/YjbR family DNA-binding protein, partial [Gemmatimonadaceae bacterium]|nr:MmcQ/YjbR family DNA-binding protein [Gemmatimonadaceae bacterium]